MICLTRCPIMCVTHWQVKKEEKNVAPANLLAGALFFATFYAIITIVNRGKNILQTVFCSYKR